MLHGNTLRITLTGALLALVAAVPVAHAQQTSSDVHVCNQATHVSAGGDLVATDAYSGPAAKYTDGLKAKTANGRGLVNAAAHSAALSVCSAPDSTTSSSDTSGGGTLTQDPVLPDVAS